MYWFFTSLLICSPPPPPPPTHLFVCLSLFNTLHTAHTHTHAHSKTRTYIAAAQHAARCGQLTFHCEQSVSQSWMRSRNTHSNTPSHAHTLVHACYQWMRDFFFSLFPLAWFTHMSTGLALYNASYPALTFCHFSYPWVQWITKLPWFNIARTCNMLHNDPIIVVINSCRCFLHAQSALRNRPPRWQQCTCKPGTKISHSYAVRTTSKCISMHLSHRNIRLNHLQ